jgi:hypothetical protein
MMLIRHRSLLVPQEEVLRVAALDFSPKCLGLIHREDRRVFDGLRRDIQFFEPAEQVFGLPRLRPVGESRPIQILHD